jgi:hypothetical protein
VSVYDEVIYARDPLRLRVFISSEMRSGELAKARKAAAAAITETGFHNPWWWEKNGIAGQTCGEAMCLGNARTSDYLILILGTRITDITRREYLAAKEAAATVIIFGPKGCERDQDSKRFFDEEAREATYGEYSSMADLKQRILESLVAGAVRANRERQLHKRHVSLEGIGQDLRVGGAM